MQSETIPKARHGVRHFILHSAFRILHFFPLP